MWVLVILRVLVVCLRCCWCSGVRCSLVMVSWVVRWMCGCVVFRVSIWWCGCVRSCSVCGVVIWLRCWGWCGFWWFSVVWCLCGCFLRLWSVSVRGCCGFVVFLFYEGCLLWIGLGWGVGNNWKGDVEVLGRFDVFFGVEWFG